MLLIYILHLIHLNESINYSIEPELDNIVSLFSEILV